MPRRPAATSSASGHHASQKPRESSFTTAEINGEQGETAYLAAFEGAAKMKPARVPNPLAYPYSPSAQEHLRQRTTRASDSASLRVINSSYVPPPQDFHSRRREALRMQRMDLDDDVEGSERSLSHSTSVSPGIRNDQQRFFPGDFPSQAQIRPLPHSDSYVPVPGVLPRIPADSRDGQPHHYANGQNHQPSRPQPMDFHRPPHHPPEFRPPLSHLADPPLINGTPRSGGVNGFGPSSMLLSPIEPQFEAPRGPRNPFAAPGAAPSGPGNPFAGGRGGMKPYQ